MVLWRTARDFDAPRRDQVASIRSRVSRSWHQFSLSAPSAREGVRCVSRASRAVSVIEAAQARLALYAEGVQCEGDDVVLADEYRHLDQLALVEVCREHVVILR